MKAYLLIFFFGYCRAIPVVEEESNVYVVTPESRAFRDYPVFLPTPVPDEPKSTRRVSTSTNSPDIIFAEFRRGSGKSSDGLLSVREMLDKEIIAKGREGTKRTTTIATTTTRAPQMVIKDVWDIIKHNEKAENKSENDDVKVDKSYVPYEKSSSDTYSVESFHSVAPEYKGWPKSVPSLEELINRTEPSTVEASNEEESRNIRDRKIWSDYRNRESGGANYVQHYQGHRQNYGPYKAHYRRRRPDMTYAIEERYNPAKPYLPPKPSKPESNGSPPAMPQPPIPMPPPPPPAPPQTLVKVPQMTYENFPSVDSSITGMKPPDTSGIYFYPKPPPSSPADNQHENMPPQVDMTTSEPSGPSGPSGPSAPSDDTGAVSYISDHDHDHHHFADFDYHDFHHHHHEEHPPPPTTTTTTTTPAPVMERVNNRYSYYYLGKKLWYLPLYFSVYFIVYVAALIIKSIARHKITYPQHYKSKRSIGSEWRMSNENVNLLTKFLSEAIVKYAENYFNT